MLFFERNFPSSFVHFYIGEIFIQPFKRKYRSCPQEKKKKMSTCHYCLDFLSSPFSPFLSFTSSSFPHFFLSESFFPLEAVYLEEIFSHSYTIPNRYKKGADDFVKQ
jgi:hypothetical protein